ncbi:Aerobic C4-dicarboxylate transport protein [compost metagenome]
MSEARALTNLVGNGVATVVVAKWCKQLDEKQLHDTLSNKPGSGADKTLPSA